MVTHHSVMTLSFCIKNLKFDKFGDFSCNIDYNCWTDLFRDVISLVINQSDPRRLGRTQSVLQPAQRKHAYIYTCIYPYY